MPNVLVARRSTDGSVKPLRFTIEGVVAGDGAVLAFDVRLVGWADAAFLRQAAFGAKTSVSDADDAPGALLLEIDGAPRVAGRIVDTGAVTKVAKIEFVLTGAQTAALATQKVFDIQGWVQEPGAPAAEIRTLGGGTVQAEPEVTRATALIGALPASVPTSLSVAPASLEITDAETGQLVATVLDQYDAPMAGATVLCANDAAGTASTAASHVTDEDGEATFDVDGQSAGAAHLSFTVQGYPGIAAVARTVTVTAAAPSDPDLAMVAAFNAAGPAQFRHLRVFDKLKTLTNGKVSRWGNLLDDTNAKAMVTRPGFVDGAPVDGAGYITGEGLYCPAGSGLGALGGAAGATWGVVSKYVSSGDASENGTILSVGIYGTGSAYGGMRLVRSSNADSLGLSPTDSATQVFVASGVKMSDAGFHTHYMHLNGARDLLLVHSDRDMRDQFTNDGGYIAALLPSADYDVYLAPFRAGTYAFTGKIAAEFSLTGRPNRAQNKILNDWSRDRLGQVDATNPVGWMRGNSIIRGAANGASGRIDAWVPAAHPTLLVLNRGYSGCGFGGPKNGITDYLDDDNATGAAAGGRSAFNYMEAEMDWSARSRVVWLGWEGTNDRLGAGAAEINRYLTWFDHIMALKATNPNLRVAAGTWLPFGAGATNTGTTEYGYTRTIMTALPAHSDVQFDPANDATMGYASGNVANGTYYDPDFVHPTAAGQAALVPMYQAALSAALAMA